MIPPNMQGSSPPPLHPSGKRPSRRLYPRRIFGPYSRPVLIGVLWPLLFGSFFGTLIFAASRFPTHYDWRYRVISNLLSPRDNPQIYWLPSLGISLGGLLMVPFVIHLQAFLRRTSEPISRSVGFSFLVGVAALIASALVVPQHAHPFLGTTRWHEIFADTSALGMGLGMLGASYCARIAMASPDCKEHNSILFWTWSTLAILPLGGVAICEGLLVFSHSQFATAHAIRNCLRHSVLWHLGFWEWIAAAAVFLFFGAGAWLIPAPIQPRVGSRKTEGEPR